MIWRHNIHIAFTILVLLTDISAVSGAESGRVVLDGTLGRQMELSGPIYEITSDLGKQHGGNLFHSFDAFSIKQDETALFSGPDNVENIISRVTGGFVSLIDGELRSAIPKADMFFINPAGITFGKNAKLEIQGSFYAATADTIRFKDGAEFNAIHPESSSLTIAPAASFGFLSDSRTSLLIDKGRLAFNGGDDSRTLSFIGENLQIDDSTITISSGQLTLAGIADPGSFDIENKSVNGQSADILIQNSKITGNNSAVHIDGNQVEINNSVLEVNMHNANPTQGINIQANRLAVTNGGKLESITSSEYGGDITVSADESVILSGHNVFNGEGSVITSYTERDGIGGNIKIKTNQLDIANGAKIGTATFGLGQGGNVFISTTGLIRLSGSDASDGYAAIILTSEKEDGSAGNAGNLNIVANQLRLENGASIHTDSLGTGNAGNIRIVASDTIIISGVDATGLAGVITSQSRKENDQNAGNSGIISITAGQLVVNNGGGINNTTLGFGQGNNIMIHVSGGIVLSGEDMTSEGSGIVSKSESTSNGGKAGSISIEAGYLLINDGGGMSVTTNSSGEGGNINIRVYGSIVLSGKSTFGGYSRIMATTRGTGKNAAKSGTIFIEAECLQLLDGGTINVGTYGIGQGGDIIVHVKDKVTVSSSQREIGSLISAETHYAGKGGTITLRAKQLEIIDSTISGATYGTGQAGNIDIQLDDSIIISGDGNITATTEHPAIKGAGNGGNIFLKGRRILLINGAQIITSTFGTGHGGDIIIQAEDSIQLSGESEMDFSIISSQSGGVKVDGGNGGSILLMAQELVLSDGARIDATTFGKGQGGNITILVDSINISGENSIGFMSGLLTGTSGRMASAGNGGKIKISGLNLSLSNGAIIDTATWGTGDSGFIEINMAENLKISGSSSFGLQSGIYNGSIIAGRAGDIQIKAPQIVLIDGGAINSMTQSFGQGGKITLIVDRLALEGSKTNINTNTQGAGKGGSIIIKATDTTTIASGHITGSSSGTQPNAGKGGDIEIETPRLALTDNASIESNTSGTGEGGTVTLAVNNLHLENSAEIDSGTAGTGAGGAIDITAAESVRLDNSTVSANTEAQQSHGGRGGEIEINTPQLILNNGTAIASGTTGTGTGGDITVKLSGPFTLSGPNRISANSQSIQADAGKGGNIEIHAPQIVLADGALIQSDTSGSGEGGLIILKAMDTLTLSNAKISGTSQSTAQDAGKAGEIHVSAENLNLTDGGEIRTSTKNASGGNILISVNDFLYLLENGAITTSVTGGIGDGGDIKISGALMKNSDHPQNGPAEFVLLDKAKIIAQAVEGKGGNINIDSKNFLRSGDSIVSASSQLGIDGAVLVTAPEANLIGALDSGPLDFLETGGLPRCVNRSAKEWSSFVVRPLENISPPPDDFNTPELLSIE